MIFIEKNLDSKGYVELLKNNNIIEDIKSKFDENKIHFQQDGAPCHTASNTMKWLKNEINVIDDWPPNSPDLSPIENLWSILKLKVNDRKIDDWNQIKEEYQKIDQNIINNLIKSMINRFRLCIENEGHSIARFIHKHHKYDNEISKIENMSSDGIMSPKDVDEKCINNYISVGGIITRKRKVNETIMFRIVDHPHLVEKYEVPHFMDVITTEEFGSEYKPGCFEIFYGIYKPDNENGNQFTCSLICIQTNSQNE